MYRLCPGDGQSAVDVLVSAIDHPVDSENLEKNIIMIFSGNESVLYPVSLLVFRNYTVYLVIPDGTNGTTTLHQTSFRDIATRTFSWCLRHSFV